MLLESKVEDRLIDQTQTRSSVLLVGVRGGSGSTSGCEGGSSYTTDAKCFGGGFPWEDGSGDGGGRRVLSRGWSLLRWREEGSSGGSVDETCSSWRETRSFGRGEGSVVLVREMILSGEESRGGRGLAWVGGRRRSEEGERRG